MAPKDDAKNARQTAKGAVTKQVNKLGRLMAEMEKDKVKTEVERLRTIFETFETAHDGFHSHLTTLEEQEESDTYFMQVEDKYSHCLKEVRCWLKIEEASLIPPAAPQASSSSAVSNDVMSLMSLPKIELEVFEGDPLKYHSFQAMFEECVEKVITDDNVS